MDTSAVDLLYFWICLHHFFAGDVRVRTHEAMRKAGLLSHKKTRSFQSEAARTGDRPLDKKSSNQLYKLRFPFSLTLNQNHY